MQTNLINVNAGFFDDVSSDFFVIHLAFGDLKFFRRDIPFILLLDGLLWVLLWLISLEFKDDNINDLNGLFFLVILIILFLRTFSNVKAEQPSYGKVKSFKMIGLFFFSFLFDETIFFIFDEYYYSVIFAVFVVV